MRGRGEDGVRAWAAWRGVDRVQTYDTVSECRNVVGTSRNRTSGLCNPSHLDRVLLLLIVVFQRPRVHRLRAGNDKHEVNEVVI